MANSPAGSSTPVPPIPKRLSGPGAHLCAKIASSLASAEPGELDAEIERALQMLGRFLAVDVVSLCRLGPTGDLLRAEREWRATGWMDPPLSLNVSEAHWWSERQRASEDILIDDVASLPAEAVYEHTALQQRGTLSLLAVPVRDPESRSACVAAESLSERRRWLPEEVALLTTFCDCLGSALQRAHHHRKLLSTANRAEQASEERRQFIAMLAHELRTPLTAIIGYAQMLESELSTAGVSGLGEHVDQILQCASHVSAVVEDTLDLARIDSGRMPLHLADFDVREAIDGALAAVKPRAHTEEIQLSCEIPVQPVTARADARKLRQLAINLLVNAIKFSPEGGRVVIRLRSTADGYEIEVEDSGPGIAERDRERIFESFTRADFQAAPDSPGGEGVGLGLSLVQRLCSLHGGRIRLDSEPGRGTRFTVWLPEKSPESAVGREAYVSSRPQA